MSYIYLQLGLTEDWDKVYTCIQLLWMVYTSGTHTCIHSAVGANTVSLMANYNFHSNKGLPGVKTKQYIMS